MDVSQFKLSTWLMTGGAAGMVIFGLFVDWSTVEGLGISISGGNAFDWTRGTLSWIFVVAVGVIAAGTATGSMKKIRAPWSLIMVMGSLAATVLMTLLVLTGPDQSGVDLGRGVGLWLSYVSTLVVLGGSIMEYTTSGGHLTDLTDIDKLKESFRPDGEANPT
jgi:hypothetical protein